MKRFSLSIVCTLLAFLASAQYPIGHRQITYQDPARANRNVASEIYYPGVANGDNVDAAAGQFPVIIFGHGFVITYDAYSFWKDNLVPVGYIVVFPTTEGSFSPSHADFGADLAFLLNKLQSEGSNSSSPFYQKVAATSAIMGHSMGGGSSFLACQNNVVPTCMITFAAANTNPSSIHAARSVYTPSLVMSGEADCVAPPAGHQVPMYDSLASNCKVYISIKEGGHCYFGDYNFLCIAAESTCNPLLPSITNAEQEATALSFVKPYLDFYLNSNLGAWTLFLDSLSVSNKIMHQISCTPGGVPSQAAQADIRIFPNPASEFLTVEYFSDRVADLEVSIYNLFGERIVDEAITSVSGQFRADVDVHHLNAGLFFIEIRSGEIRICRKIQIVGN